jgi:excisionase family DNA binding protein
MHTAAHRRYISPSQAAKELGMSTSTAYRAIESGYLRAVRGEGPASVGPLSEHRRITKRAGKETSQMGSDEP